MTDREVMQMVLDALELKTCDAKYEQDCSTCNAIEALHAALAQPEPEPVAWMIRENFANLGFWEERIIFTLVDEGRGTPLYMAQPQPKKEWVGLTDEEIKVCAKGGRSIGISFHDAICRAEAKLKEKNT